MRYEGDIYRPPGEWRSYILQATIGCSHNNCTFCGMYKDKKFRVRPLTEILEDVRMARMTLGRVDRVFVCDGDAIVMKTEDWLVLLKQLYASFPDLKKVTTYAGPRSTLAKSSEELVKLREAGLTRAYLGVESGCDRILKEVNKGVDSDTMLKAGRHLIEAGIDVWCTILLGLDGKGVASEEHALATAKLINEMRPGHVSAMTYTAVPGTPLYEKVRSGEFKLLDAQEALRETRMFIENIEFEGLHFTSNHVSNYLPLKGTLRQDRERLLNEIDNALNTGEGLRKRPIGRSNL
ncbi:MAG: radical SAM protein [Oscillospiraceae bacterium]|jgi:radical SAM superfamily enzyme YgiQ (UPF0313 family)